MLRALDVGLLRLLRTRGHSPQAEAALQALARAGEHGILWQGLAGLGALVDRERAPLYGRAMATVLAAMIANTLIKYLVGRARPQLEGLPPLTPTLSGRSYPSAHAATSFAGARMLSAALPAPPLYALACAVAFSRPYLGVHYPSDVAAGALLGDALGRLAAPGAVKVGIVGLPNAGKSSLFNALTRAGAQAANYPFTTVEPNVAVVPVPDERLDKVAATVGATPVVHDSIEFHDIAGLVRGAHRGEGLGNKFLGNIRETDAIVHVVRAHDDAQVVHPEGRVDPISDVDAVDTELLFADLEQAERRLERVSKQAKSLDKVAVAEERWLTGVIEALREGQAVRTVPPPADAPGADVRLQALTSKPVLYVANVAEGEPLEPPPALVEYAESRGARATAVSARLDSELSELDDDDADNMRAELGVVESGLTTVIREAFALLDLISFFTAGEGKEARAHAIPRGTPARRAAGSVHSDIERGFVAAEITPWNELVDAGGYAAARERAKLRVEGRDYAMQDGDVVTFRFTP